MKILNRWTNACIFESPHETMKETLVAAVVADSDLSGSNLSGSNLSGSNLSGSNLRGSNLSGSDLSGSNLSGSDLSGSNLSGSDLRGSNLSGSDLRGSNLSGSNLSGSNLRGSNLSGVIVYGCTLGVQTFDDYLRIVVPALLKAGGKSLQSFLSAGVWDCHTWDNCPMAFAFDIKTAESAPPLLIPRVQQFVALFDARLIPRSVIEAAVDAERV